MSNIKGSIDTAGVLKVKALAKINLHLEVLGLRSDGFHELAMVMQSIDLSDRLEFKNNKGGDIKLTCDSQSLATDDDNLIIKAAQLLRSHSGQMNLGAVIHLQKNIPIGAGLAGGSSDGAATLVGLNNLWSLGLPYEDLEKLASELGSDVPFCLAGGTQLCFGRGERLEPLTRNDNSMAVLLVKDPLVSVSTPWAYNRCKEINGGKYLDSEHDFEYRRKTLRDAAWLREPCKKLPPPLYNDLQFVVAPEVPSVKRALTLLSDLPGAISVAMSGSGPSCFALYPDLESAKNIFESHQVDFREAGLDSWCCSLGFSGVMVE